MLLEVFCLLDSASTMDHKNVWFHFIILIKSFIQLKASLRHKNVVFYLQYGCWGTSAVTSAVKAYPIRKTILERIAIPRTAVTLYKKNYSTRLEEQAPFPK